MEMTGVQEAAQVVNVAINGSEVFLKLGGSFTSWNVEQLKALFTFLYRQYEKQKDKPEVLSEGEVSIDKLFQVCGDHKERVAVLQIDERIKDEFIQYCNNNKLTYSFLLDGNKSDGKTEIAYRESQAPAFEAFIMSHYPMASAYSFEEYRDNIRPEDILAAENELSAESKKEINRQTEGKGQTEEKPFKELDGEVSLDNLASSTDQMIVAEMKLAILDDFKNYAAENHIAYAPLSQTEDTVFFAFDAKQESSVAEFAEKGIHNMSFTEYLDQNNVDPKDLKQMEVYAKKMHISSDKHIMMEVKRENIVDKTDYGVKIKMQNESGNKEYVTIPIEHLLQSGDTYFINLPANATFTAYQNEKYFYKDEYGIKRKQPQQPSGNRYSAEQISKIMQKQFKSFSADKENNVTFTFTNPDTKKVMEASFKPASKVVDHKVGKAR